MRTDTVAIERHEGCDVHRVAVIAEAGWITVAVSHPKIFHGPMLDAPAARALAAALTAAADRQEGGSDV